MKKENEQEAGPGLRPSTADRGIKQLRGIISLYRQTTEMLIKEYISDAADRPVSTAAPCGEVLIEVNARKHPGSGELVGSIRGMGSTATDSFPLFTWPPRWPWVSLASFPGFIWLGEAWEQG